MITVAEHTTLRNSQIITANYGLTPYQIGVLDATEGLPFAPEVYVSFFIDCLDYTAGFESVRGENEITRSYKAQWGEPMEDESIESDHEWIRHGC